MPNRLRCCLVIVFLTGFLPNGLAAESFEIFTSSAQRLTGQLQSWTEETLVVATNGGQTQRIASEDLVWLGADDRRPQTVNGGSLVLLANGDRLRGTVVGIDELSVRMKWSVFSKLPELEIPFETVRAILAEIPRLAEPRRNVIAAALKPHSGQDILRLKNSDELTGILTGMNDGIYSIDRAGRELRIPDKDVQVVLLDDELVNLPEEPSERVLLVLSDGSWITLTKWKLIAGREIHGRAECGVDLVVSLNDVVSARFFGGKAVWLTEQKNTEYEHTPYLATKWDLRVNRNVLDGFLQIGTREFPIGLGQHSQSEVTYQLDQSFQRFRTTIGLDDTANGRGAAVFRIQIDGRERFRSPLHVGRGQRESIDLDVTNAETITLGVEFGPRGDVRDYANWVDPVLLP
ncbi:NPCBM/NEW2 domain-containing protein [Thalassoroseus pseudoceratinae]|uniref:NPCBM/NEW2 domain-containing protein n=1 Tax=Thalassoroseus pseudoceratinae TaxID=2713176 RepID=UPI00141E74DE|nr:NPCBM/NEW2 domain-containing protein [Thalassoroseus pseudoceratinae]